VTNHSGGGTPRRTGVCIPIPGTDSARVIIIPQLASDTPLTGDEQLLLKLHDELATAQSALAEKERERDEMQRRAEAAEEDMKAAPPASPKGGKE